MSRNERCGSPLRTAALAGLCVLLSACAPSPRSRKARGLGPQDLERIAAEVATGAGPAAPRDEGLAGATGEHGDAAASGTAAGDEAAELAKKTQNPVSSMISLPLQNNFNLGVGPEGHTQYILNIQPVYPMSLSENWNWIHRLIMPVIDQPDMAPRGAPPAVADALDGEFGLGDINYQGFLSPAKPGKIIWGIGPQLVFPTASDDILGSDKWSAGPALIVLTMQGPWVYGSVVSNVWSFAGDDDRDDVSLMTIQPFVNYNFPGGLYLKYGPIMTCNWKADSGDRWTVPIGGGVGKILKIGKQPVNMSVAAYYNVEHPDDGAEWQVQLQFQLLFPK